MKALHPRMAAYCLITLIAVWAYTVGDEAGQGMIERGPGMAWASPYDKLDDVIHDLGPPDVIQEVVAVYPLHPLQRFDLSERPATCVSWRKELQGRLWDIEMLTDADGYVKRLYVARIESSGSLAEDAWERHVAVGCVGEPAPGLVHIWVYGQDWKNGPW